MAYLTSACRPRRKRVGAEAPGPVYALAAVLIVSLITTALFGGCLGGTDVNPGPDNGQTGGDGTAGVKLVWYGHAAFLIVSPGGVRVLTDPYPGNMGYGNRNFTADLVTVSHEHFDHNAVAAVDGDPDVLRGLSGGDWATAEKTIGDVTAYSIKGTYHDNQQGRTGRGKNSLFLIEAGDLRILHLGDLGEVPSEEIARQCGRVDVLLIPVGGLFTIDAETATRVADLFGARIIVPMHYRTAAISDWEISDVEPFLEGKDGVRRLTSSEAVIDPANLPDTPEIWVFQVAP